MMKFEELEEKMEKSSQDYMNNTEPYKSMIEEASGFSSGVSWTLKKLKKLGLLKIEDEQ